MTALVIIPFAVNDGNLAASNVPETDHSAWLVGTTYALGDRVIVVATHKVYESSAAGNTGNDPTVGDVAWWFEVGSTNRWRAFDGTLGQSTSQADSITCTIGLPSRADAIAFIDLGAVTAKVVVKNASAVTTFTEERTLLDTSGITSWLDFFTYEDTYDPEVVFSGLGALSGYTIEITLTNTGGTVEVSEIVAGKAEYLGEILDGSRSGFTDYTKKTVDDFGNISFIKRPTARKAEWVIAFETLSNRRIQRALESARASAAFFYPGDDMSAYYVSVYGVADDFFPQLASGGTTIATLALTGVS